MALGTGNAKPIALQLRQGKIERGKSGKRHDQREDHQTEPGHLVDDYGLHTEILELIRMSYPRSGPGRSANAQTQPNRLNRLRLGLVPLPAKKIAG